MNSGPARRRRAKSGPIARRRRISQWRVILKRGQRSWVILSHHWLGEEERRSTALPLKRGAYELTVEFVRSAPEFASDEQVDPQRTGFQVKYAGPDSDGRRIEIPHSRLFALWKDQTLGRRHRRSQSGRRVLSGRALYQFAARHPADLSARLQGAAVRPSLRAVGAAPAARHIRARLHAGAEGQLRRHRLLPRRRGVHAPCR